MITRNTDGTIAVKGASYDLCVKGHIVEVILCGTSFVSLDIRTAVNGTNDDYTTAVDAEETVPTLASVEEKKGEVVFTWTNKSALWEKEYRMVCTYTRFRYYVKVKGHGRVDSVNYFSGNMAQKNCGSGYEFSEGFNPCKPYDMAQDYYFRASLPCYRPSIYMCPPMFCYAFRCEGIGERLALGLVAERGEHNFHSFNYNHRWGFYLSTDQDGHTAVDGEWTAPYIIGYSAPDEFAAMQKYSEYYFASGIAKPRSGERVPRFWHGPLACGWIEQGGWPGGCTEELYERMHRRLKENDLHPTAVIIDDKWMSHYATDIADPEKWPDFRAYVDRHHAEGINTMLWFMLFHRDGWDDELCLKGDLTALSVDPDNLMVDPSHPKFIENLDRAMERIFSDAEGCYDCDGLKLDYAFANPKGKKFRTYSGKYGAELLYDMYVRIYEKAKEYKPTALINTSACHPYFSHVCDQGRLHDYYGTERYNLEDLSMRGRMFSIAMPGVLLDTDNSGFVTRRDTMRWQLNQNLVGVPDLYAISPNAALDAEGEALGAIAEMWREYSAKIDAMYASEEK